jgi:hypothetical protein
MAVAWPPTERWGDEAGVGEADDVARGASDSQAQPQRGCQRWVAKSGGEASGGRTLSTPSAFASMGHFDVPCRHGLSRDIHFEKSPKSRARTRAKDQDARINFGRVWAASIVQRRRCTQGSSSRMLSLRHSIGHRSPCGTRQGGPKSVPYVCCSASPPPTVNYARFRLLLILFGSLFFCFGFSLFLIGVTLRLFPGKILL